MLRRGLQRPTSDGVHGEIYSRVGLKYDGDARIAYVTAGLYGFWGEWQVLASPLPGEPAGWTMAQKDKDALLRAYADRVLRGLRCWCERRTVTTDHELLSHFGFHDDSLLQDTIGEGAGNSGQACS